MKRLLAVLVLLMPVGCSSGSSGTIGQAASARMTPEVEQVRIAATTGDRAAAKAKLAELRRTVADLRQRDELSPAAAAKVLTAADEVEARLGDTPTSPLSPSSSTSTPAPTGTKAPPSPGTSNEKDNGGGKGRGKGG